MGTEGQGQAAVMAPAPGEGRRIEHLPVSSIRPPKYNPRKRMDPARLEELKGSIRRYGVLQNLVVKPVGADQYEVVAGARRHQALLGIQAEVAAYYDRPAASDEEDEAIVRLHQICREVPCLVKEGAEADEALEVQLVENLQREDLDPVAEAEGYRFLIEQRGFSARELAERIGKDPAFVARRLVVPMCPGFFLDAMRDGRVSVSHCELIGRIPSAADREEAARRVLEPKYDTKPLTRDEAAEMIRKEFVVGLQNCGFDPEAARLVPDAPVCSACEFRSGNNAELADDLQELGTKKGGVNPNLCLKPACFRAKSEATWRIMQRQAEGASEPVIAPDVALRVFAGPGGSVAHNSEYVDLDDRPSAQETGVCAAGERVPTWRKLLQGCEVTVCVARHPETGRIHEMVSRKVARAAVDERFEATGKASPLKASPAKEREAAKAAEREQAERRKAEREEAMDALDGLIQKLADEGRLSDTVARTLLGHVLAQDVAALDLLSEVLGVGRHPTEVDEMMDGGEPGYVLAVLAGALVAGEMRRLGPDAPVYQALAIALGLACARLSDTDGENVGQEDESGEEDA